MGGTVQGEQGMRSSLLFVKAFLGKDKDFQKGKGGEFGPSFLGTLFGTLLKGIRKMVPKRVH